MTKPIRRVVLINSTTLAPCPNSHELNLFTDNSISRIQASGLLMTGEVSILSVLCLYLFRGLLRELFGGWLVGGLFIFLL